MNHAQITRLTQLADALCEGPLSNAHMAELDSMLGDLAARQIYTLYLDMHLELGARATGPSLTTRRARPPRLDFRLPLARVGIAAALVIGFTLAISALVSHAWRNRPMVEGGPIATLADAKDAVWGSPALGPSQITEPGSPLRSGWVSLRSGRATIVFQSGAEVTLSGPAEFAMNSEKRAFLRRGTLTAFVPPQARGFSVGAPGCAVIDLGTRFRMRVGDEGETDVRVLQGRVRVEREDGESKELTINHEVRVGPDRIVEVAGPMTWSYRLDDVQPGRPIGGYPWRILRGTRPIVAHNDPQLPGPFLTIGPNVTCRVQRENDSHPQFDIPDRSTFTLEFDLRFGDVMGAVGRVGLVDSVGHVLLEFGNSLAKRSDWTLIDNRGHDTRSGDHFPRSHRSYDHLVGAVDLAAFGGEGSFSLAVAPIGQTPVPVAGLQNINLHLASTPGSQIRGLLVNLANDGAVSNITLTANPG